MGKKAGRQLRASTNSLLQRGGEANADLPANSSSLSASAESTAEIRVHLPYRLQGTLPIPEVCLWRPELCCFSACFLLLSRGHLPSDSMVGGLVLWHWVMDLKTSPPLKNIFCPAICTVLSLDLPWPFPDLSTSSLRLFHLPVSQRLRVMFSSHLCKQFPVHALTMWKNFYLWAKSLWPQSVRQKATVGQELWGTQKGLLMSVLCIGCALLLSLAFLAQAFPAFRSTWLNFSLLT